jgi:hypothetical protein
MLPLHDGCCRNMLMRSSDPVKAKDMSSVWSFTAGLTPPSARPVKPSVRFPGIPSLYSPSRGELLSIAAPVSLSAASTHGPPWTKAGHWSTRPVRLIHPLYLSKIIPKLNNPENLAPEPSAFLQIRSQPSVLNYNSSLAPLNLQSSP